MRRFRPAAVLAATIGLMSAAAPGAKELSLGLSSEPSSIDPHFENRAPNNAMATHIFGRLIEQDDKQRLVPGLALSWVLLDDTTWEFTLRKDVKFHDGTPFTAADVLFSFERAPNVEGSPSSFATYTKGKTLTEVDDYIVRITTERPHPLMPQDVSKVHIVSRRHGTGAKTPDYDSGRTAIGTGPYKFVEYLPGKRIVLERYEGFYGEKPEWIRATFRPIKDGPSRVAALLAGEVDIIDRLPTEYISKLKDEPGLSLSQGISDRLIYLQMDQYRDESPDVRSNDGGGIPNPLKDVRVRKAISKAIHRDAIVETIMAGAAITAGQFLPLGFFGTTPELRPEPYDPEGAKKLLAEAGYPDGFKLKLHGPGDRYINDAEIAEAIGRMLTRVGIKTEVVIMPSGEFFRYASRGGPGGTPGFSFILVGWGADTGEASSPLMALIHTYDQERRFGMVNRGRHSDPEIDTLIEDALTTLEPIARRNLLAKATELAIERNQAIIPLHYQINTWAARNGIKYRPRTDERTPAMGAYSE